jgi:hypothetical protein
MVSRTALCNLLSAKQIQITEYRNLIGIPEHTFDSFWIGHKSHSPIKIHYMRVSEESDVADILTPKFLDHELHQRLTQTLALEVWVNHHIPDGGIESVVRSGTGETNKASGSTSLLPHGSNQKAVFDRFLNFAHGTPRPPNGIAEFF